MCTSLPCVTSKFMVSARLDFTGGAKAAPRKPGPADAGQLRGEGASQTDFCGPQSFPEEKRQCWSRGVQREGKKTNQPYQKLSSLSTSDCLHLNKKSVSRKPQKSWDKSRGLNIDFWSAGSPEAGFFLGFCRIVGYRVSLGCVTG